MNEKRPGRIRSAFVGRARRTGLVVAAATAVLGTAALLLPSAATAASPSPFTAHLDSVTAATGSVIVRGWAVDTAQLDASARVTTYVGGTAGSPGVIASGQVLAHDTRTDVGRVTPYGDHRGFGNQLYVTPGTYPVCTYVSAYTGAGSTLLGCVTVTVNKNIKPIGHFEHAVPQAGGAILVTGWAADPNTPASPVAVNIYLGGTFGHAIKSVSAPANLPRADVAAALPSYGAAHGFSVLIPAPSGTYPVCTYALDDVGGPSTLFPCLEVTVN